MRGGPEALQALADGRADLERILAAVESQIAPEGHFYIYGESERLAAPVLPPIGRLILPDEIAARRAIATWGRWAWPWPSRWIWRWKARIDHGFMRRCSSAGPQA